jgi:UDP-N-acetylmuramate dehydrogenase
VTAWANDFARQFPEAKLNEPLARYTTFRIGGPADAYLEIRERDALVRASAFCRSRGVPLIPLGFGSNVLILDAGVRGVVFRLRGDFETADFLPGLRARAGAGVRVPQLVALCAERGLAGAEPLVGVPGTVGGALVMNAGTRDAEIGALTLEVEVFDLGTGASRVMGREALRFEYRRSNLDSLVVLSGLFQLKAGDKAVIMGRVQEFQQRRLQTQPIHTFNVGSTFKNPPGRFVAKLIEEAGLKGAAVGGARISPLHANFIENVSNARASDVLALVSKVQETILARFGLQLELEMKVLG